MTASVALGPSRLGDIQDNAEKIELEFPAQAELFFLARMTAAAVGSRADFGCDQIDDLRLAIDEMFLMLLHGRNPRVQIRLGFKWNDDAVDAFVTIGDRDEGALRMGGREVVVDTLSVALSERILETLVDEYGSFQAESRSGFWFRLRRQ